MYLIKNKTILLSLFLILSFTVPVLAQSDLTPSQRLELMRQRIETMRRSLSSSVSVLRNENKEDKSKKDDKSNLETPLGRLSSLEKEVSGVQSEVNTLRGRIERTEKYELGDIEQLETTVKELQTRVDNALVETASARANPESMVGKPREVKEKTKKLLWLIPIGKERDEYEELIGTITPGRDKELFVVATREVRKKNYEVGRLLLQTIITTYPDSPYLPMAKLAVADSFFLEGSTSSLIQAAAGYQDWLTFFPTHALADRVLLKIAESEMRQIGLPDRDSTNAKKAEQRLRALLQMYPNTPLRPLVEIRLEEVQDNLGLHNLWIANFYYKQSVNYKKGGLKGAQSRYKEILDKYPNFNYMDEALFKIAVTYMLEEETDQAARYFQRLVSDYPNSDYVEKAKEQLNLIGATIPEANPERRKVLPPEKKSFFENFKNEFLGIYPLTIDKNGVLMTKDFDKTKFELIDQVIENQGVLLDSQIPKALTTVVSERPEARQEK